VVAHLFKVVIINDGLVPENEEQRGADNDDDDDEAPKLEVLVAVVSLFVEC
jgi:hypothetical protein